MWHVVLTQRVIPEEALRESKTRFEASWKKFYRTLRANGMVSALATYHVTASGVKGWHFHCHLVVEIQSAVSDEDLYKIWDDAWFAALGDGESQRKALFVRKVCDPGDALEGLTGDKQMEFWSESKDPVEVLLQYVLRDILQGVEGWVERLRTDDQAEAFASAINGTKLHRLYGVWRKKLATEEEDGADGASEKAEASAQVVGCVKSVVCWTVVGSMDEVLWWARQGQTDSVEMVRRLLGRGSNRGAVSLRLSRLVKE